jgi:hypothetical protein
MRILTAIIQLAVTAPLFSCDQQHSTSDIDPKLGLECFETYRASLPPGTQYEGIEKLSENGLTIKIMDGVHANISRNQTFCSGNTWLFLP